VKRVRYSRVVLSIAALVCMAASVCGVLAARASAAPSSQITSPGNPTYTLVEPQVAEEGQVAFTVEGAAKEMAQVDLDCYRENGDLSYGPIASGVAVNSDGSFSAQVRTSSLEAAACTLRAVPSGDKGKHAPGPEDPYQGPQIASTDYFKFASGGYEVYSHSVPGFFSILSGGSCYQDFSGLGESEELFGCKAALAPGLAEEGSGIEVDGSVAYDPSRPPLLAEELEIPLPSAPPVTSSKAFDSATGAITLHEVDPIVKCSPEAIAKPTAESCKELVPTGVTLERTWQTANGDRVALVTDTWRSTDGRTHTLDLGYGTALNVAPKAGAADRLPGAATFSTLATVQEHVSLPTGAGAIYYKEDAAAPDEGDGLHLSGAIVYDTSPTAPTTIENEGDFSAFLTPYRFSLPAGASHTLRMAFVQGYGLAEVSTLAGEALASYAPSLTIASPANGTTVSTPSVGLSGTAADSGHVASVAVNGQVVNVGGGGEWSANVSLSPGANTITAVATDDAGLTASRSVSVNYSPPPPAPSPPQPVVHASQVGPASGSDGKVTVTLACQGAAGTSCLVDASVSTVEKTRGGKTLAVSAKARVKQRSRQVTVGAAKMVIKAGQQVKLTLTLNALGRRLLARFHKLPVHLTVVLVADARKTTVVSRNLTVKPKPAKQKRGERQHKKH
jgi:hypothetical protein